MSSILIFDSGVGGLSIFKDVRTLLPNTHIDYVADHAAYPYGDKSEDWLIRRVNQLVNLQVHQLQPSLIIIACNTASTLALPSLRSHINIPIIGVVPAIKTAAMITETKRIGLLATPGTISRTYIDDLIADFAQGCHITRVGTTDLVHLAEDKLAGKPVNDDILRNAIAPFINESCDTVVLGCTHFPLLKNELSRITNAIQWVDSGEAIARRAKSLLGNTSLGNRLPRYQFFSTSNLTAAMTKQLNHLGFDAPQTITFPISASC